MRRPSLAVVWMVCAIAAGMPSSAAAQAAAAAPPTMAWQAVDRIVTAAVIDVRGVGVVRLAGVEEGGEVSRAFLAGLISSRAVHIVTTAHSTGLTDA